ncbi:ArnT family glycosyltransferase [Patescibacteria group bacterium]
MKNNFRIIWKNIVKEINEHKIVYLILAIVLIGALFIRTYRTDQILGFYFDQGRDALKIWDFWHKGDLMLIGPTTGIAGILRGPFYFYLIAPFYLLGGGDPVIPAYMLAFVSVLAILLAYYLGYKIHSRGAGLIAALVSSFSYYMMIAGRWLSNPTPMLLLSMILVWMMWIITKEKDKKSSKAGWGWAAIGLISGLSLWHFGSSGELFYFPALFVFFLWQLGLFGKNRSKWRSSFPQMKYLLLGVGAFVFMLSPLILFDFMNNHLLSLNIKKFLLEDESFKVNFFSVVQERLEFFYGVYASKIFNSIKQPEKFLLAITAISLVGFLPRFIKNDGIKILLLMLISPIVGMLFFQGNRGNIYDYYMTGYYMIFILLFAVVLGEIWKYKLGKLFVVIFILIFCANHFSVVKEKISSSVHTPTTIVFGNQVQAVEWILKDADGRDFNTDVYVPPVIPHSYDYLFTWIGSSKYDNTPIDEKIDLLYTLAEADPPHPERLELWTVRQMSIGSIEETQQFGGITVTRRKRLIYE